MAGATYKAMEFVGSTVESLSVSLPQYLIVTLGFCLESLNVISLPP